MDGELLILWSSCRTFDDWIFRYHPLPEAPKWFIELSPSPLTVMVFGAVDVLSGLYVTEMHPVLVGQFDGVVNEIKSPVRVVDVPPVGT